MSSSIIVIAILGVLGNLFVWIASESIVDFLNVSNAVRIEAVESIQLVSFMLCPLLLTSVFLSYIEGRSDFKKVAINRMIIGVLMAIFPAILTSFSPSLFFAALGLLIARIISMVTSFIVFMIDFKDFKIDAPSIVWVRKLLNYGGWITASNIFGGAILSSDRLIVANILGSAVVPVYAMPIEIVSRLIIIPQSIARAIFPALCSKAGLEIGILKNARLLLGGATFLVILPLFIFADKIFILWLGSGFSLDSILIFRILLLGFLFHSLSQIPYTRLQAGDNVKLLFFNYALQCVPYIACLYFFIIGGDLKGVALVWVVRMLIEWLVLERLCFIVEKKKIFRERSLL
jgi:O-antigen/teichoic acid export membrane protein